MKLWHKESGLKRGSLLRSPLKTSCGISSYRNPSCTKVCDERRFVSERRLRFSDRYFLCIDSSNIMSTEDCWYLFNVPHKGNQQNSSCSLSTWLDVKLSMLMWIVGALEHTHTDVAPLPTLFCLIYFQHGWAHRIPLQSPSPNLQSAWANTVYRAN